MAGLTISDIVNQGKKRQQEKDMHPAVTYEEAKQIICKKLLSASENFISIGYYLKLIRDGKMYEQGEYEDIWQFAKEAFGIGMSTASRWMKMNDKYSVDGNSPYLQERYKGFNKSQLQEMMYLTDEQMKQVSEDKTVREIREIRQQEEKREEEVRIKEWFVEKCITDYRLLEKLKNIFRENESNLDKAKAFQKSISPYGFSGRDCNELRATFFSYTRGIEFETMDGHQEVSMTYIEFVKIAEKVFHLEAIKPEKDCVSCSEPVATSQEEERKDSFCDGKCFLCRNEKCNCFQTPREHCVFDSQCACTTISAAAIMRQDDPEQYKKCVGCCNACKEKNICFYVCDRINYVRNSKEDKVPGSIEQNTEKKQELTKEFATSQKYEYKKYHVESIYRKRKENFELWKEEDDGHVPYLTLIEMQIIVDALENLLLIMEKTEDCDE